MDQTPDVDATVEGDPALRHGGPDPLVRDEDIPDERVAHGLSDLRVSAGEPAWDLHLDVVWRHPARRLRGRRPLPPPDACPSWRRSPRRGRKRRGGFALARLAAGRTGKEWLLVKKADEHVDPSWRFDTALTPGGRHLHGAE
jgi:hypothetical protein